MHTELPIGKASAHILNHPQMNANKWSTTGQIIQCQISFLFYHNIGLKTSRSAI